MQSQYALFLNQFPLALNKDFVLLRGRRGHKFYNPDQHTSWRRINVKGIWHNSCEFPLFPYNLLGFRPYVNLLNIEERLDDMAVIASM